MNVYVIYTHPNPTSFNAAVRERLVQGLADGGHAVRVSDLYGEGFRPVLTGADLALAAEGRAAEDVGPYQAHILWAQVLVFIYPVWWFSPPAMLKGWFDRVFSRGFAYEQGPLGMMPKLKQKRALIVATAGGMEGFYSTMGFTAAMKKVLETGTMQFCGIPKVNTVIFHDLVNVGDAGRQGYLEQAYRLGREL